MFLAFAKSQLFVREIGTNAGQCVEEYLKTTGNRKGDPWCAAFIAWCGKSALGSKWPLPKTAGCQALFDAAKAKKLLVKTPLPGDLLLVYFKSMGRYAHVAIVGAVQDNQVLTIEGNTNPDGGREGYGVFERVRPLNSPTHKYIRWSTAS